MQDVECVTADRYLTGLEIVLTSIIDPIAPSLFRLACSGVCVCVCVKFVCSMKNYVLETNRGVHDKLLLLARLC